MRHGLVAFVLLSLLLSPVRGQSGPQLTQSSVVGGGGVSTHGSIRVEGAVGQSSAGASGGGAFTLYGGFFAPGQGPSVLTVARASANPAAQNSSVSYAVTFNGPVTGVDATDFRLTTAGINSAGVTGVTGGGAIYDVTVATGTPAAVGATLRLDVVDDDTVSDASGDPMGGAGIGNGNFTSGEVYTVNPVTARVNDARASEASAGTTSLLFTVTLSAPATAGGTSVGYATADGGATPATGGDACGGAVDYVTTSGTLNFSDGERIRTVSVPVCSDASSPEAAETLLLNLSNPTGIILSDAQAVGTITQGAPPGTFIISELRTSGPGGANDDFVELYNNTDAPLTVAASDASAGYGLFKTGADCDSAPVLIAIVPTGTVIPARGHYLFVGSQYSLADYGGTGAAAGDQTLTSDVESDRGVAVFNTTDIVNLSTATRLDAVGFGGNTGGAVCDLLRESNTLPPVSGSMREHSFFRKQCDFVAGVGCATAGTPKDTNDNTADFQFADTQGTRIPGVPQLLGAPGPENLTSPLKRDATVGITVIDGTRAPSAAPNRVRDFTSDPGNNSTFGTLSVRRRVINSTGANVTRLRFRVVDLTTFPNPAEVADVRVITSTDVSVSGVNDAATCLASTGSATTPCAITVQGTTLEMSPAQPNGGGHNSTLSADTVTLGSPLANGASLNVQFLLGIQTTGTFRFYITVEALP